MGQHSGGGGGGGGGEGGGNRRRLAALFRLRTAEALLAVWDLHKGLSGSGSGASIVGHARGTTVSHRERVEATLMRALDPEGTTRLSSPQFLKVCRLLGVQQCGEFTMGELGVLFEHLWRLSGGGTHIGLHGNRTKNKVIDLKKFLRHMMANEWARAT